ncbi:hypothetical protein C8A05DRAFT_47545 [Staphylotrichum tortipilum]|uniref:Mid2 domain-containing protein n=1 Tax=Staphylotrichum tortipilum TaxID=2831512 RepID=A0AAN6MD97_9PEZI|nr:hypothetical protein C8A05DRAFT_47545 [Staphylotrichum longicolle]
MAALPVPLPLSALTAATAPAQTVSDSVQTVHGSPNFPFKLCYFPSGALSPDVPCDPAADVSMCCGSADACLSSGLCRGKDTSATRGTSFARGTCTDKTWGSAICPLRCRVNQDSATNATAYDFGSGGVQVWECGGDEGYAAPAAYCCESAAEGSRCCKTQPAVFSVPGASVGNALAVQTVSGSATSSGETTSTTGTQSGTGSMAGTSSTTGTAAGGASGSAEGTSGGGQSDAVKIGVGVAIGIGAALLVAVVLVVFYWKRTHAARGPAAPSEPSAATEETVGARRGMSLRWGKPELDGNGVAVPNELDTERDMAEMPTGSERR